MLTRDKEQILLNEIHVLCMEAADHYQAALAKECVADMEAIYLDATSEHQRFAAELAACIRSQDDQPKLPDPDTESLSLFFNSIKGRLASREREVLIEDLVKAEGKLCDAAEAALRSNVRPDIRPVLERILARAKTMQQVLHERQ